MGAADAIDMKIRKIRSFIIAAVLFAGLRVHAGIIESKDTQKHNLPEFSKQTKVSMLYNTYLQNGNHSAVTGGLGTEKLQVYAPSVSYYHQNKRNSISWNVGTDIISSASTDKIDFVVSSASKLDARTHSNIQYGHLVARNTVELQAGAGFSIESDYFSRQMELGIAKKLYKGRQNLGIRVFYYWDDLRWGRLNENIHKPVKLIYPVELRNTKWFETYKRNSLSVQGKWTWAINARNNLGLFPEISQQYGLLSTPFHRVYFEDSSLKVENLPQSKRRYSMGFKWNTKLGLRNYLKNELNLYQDNFEIRSIAAGIEWIHVFKGFRGGPLLRLSKQRGTPFFAEYGKHKVNSIYYTSDYDLSSFKTLTAGFILKSIQYEHNNKKGDYLEFDFRYSFFYRTDGMKSNIISLMVSLNR